MFASSGFLSAPSEPSWHDEHLGIGGRAVERDRVFEHDEIAVAGRHEHGRFEACQRRRIDLRLARHMVRIFSHTTG